MTDPLRDEIRTIVDQLRRLGGDQHAATWSSNEIAVLLEIALLRCPAGSPAPGPYLVLTGEFVDHVAADFVTGAMKKLRERARAERRGETGEYVVVYRER